ncbi:MAG: GMC family oxidoreductase [Candidatus Binatia bacterium]|nr:GMC family oxidoreductase [Candidatus Binatia bacterium]
MLIEVRDLPDVGSVDLCIVGGGAAGITLARSLVGTGRRVLLLESGGETGDSRTQRLYDTEIVGTPYPIAGSRLRFFGGTTNHWSGQSRALDVIDFEERGWVPGSGWPISFGDLEPWLAEAHEICGLGPLDYSPEGWERTLGPDFLSGSPVLESKIFQLSSPIVRFASAYGDELRSAENVFVAVGANASEILSDEAGRQVTGIRFRSFDGVEPVVVRARAYVLACGGIENPRLLLASDSVSPGGLGNEFDNVGRYFMEHPAYSAQRLLASATFPVQGLNWTPAEDGEGPGVAIRALSPSDAAEREHGLLRSMLIFFGRDRVLGPDDDEVSGVGRAMRAGLWRGDTPKVREISATTVLEQAPNRDSRVRLSAERDELGNRRAVLDWKLGELDRYSLYRGALVVGEELARLGWARSQLRSWVPRFERPLLPGIGNHHIGTTRMSRRPEDGVVDADCRVHGLANLYVAGSSIFATAGIANPTMNLVAFALRLADHLRREVL